MGKGALLGYLETDDGGRWRGGMCGSVCERERGGGEAGEERERISF